VSIAAQLCDALQVAHDLCDEHGAQLGVVHRDVSPQNILISSAGHVQLTDFGVAKARGRLHAPTATGEIKGKLSYMAPEQVTQRDVDRRADVFALGCVLYEATVGERPFHGNDAVATLYQLLEQPLVLPSTRMPGYPLDLEEIVRKALERDPAMRYQSAEELGSALSRWIANQGRLVTERDIAAVVNERLGKAVAERTQRIAAAEHDLDAPPPASPPAPTEQTLGGSSATTGVVRARKSKRVWWAIAGGAAALVLIASLALGGGRSSNPPLVASTPVTPINGTASAAPIPVPPPTTTATTAAEAPITVTLIASPPRAALYLDDGPALPNPYLLTVAPDSKPHQVRASAPGFADRTEELRLDGNKEVRLTLAALPPGAHSPIVKPKASAEPTRTGTQAPTSGDLPKVVTKRPRVLDNDNPFGNP